MVDDEGKPKRQPLAPGTGLTDEEWVEWARILEHPLHAERGARSTALDDTG